MPSVLFSVGMKKSRSPFCSGISCNRPKDFEIEKVIQARYIKTYNKKMKELSSKFGEVVSGYIHHNPRFIGGRNSQTIKLYITKTEAETDRMLIYRYYLKDYKLNLSSLGDDSFEVLTAVSKSESFKMVILARVIIGLVVTGIAAIPVFSHAEVATKTLSGAGREVTAEAVAHYARSRALLVSAIEEFDRGRSLAKPDELLDATKWRNTLIDRAEDLERVLDPQPRATRGGIKFQADSRLLPEAKR